MDIDTGAMVARLRAESHGAIANGIARLGASHYGALVTLGRTLVRAGHAVGMDLPAAGHAAPAAQDRADAVAVYFPSCMGRILAGGNDPLLALADRAGVFLRVPDALADGCCGLPYHSKGFPEAGDALRGRTIDHLRRVSEEGRLPVVVDGSSCTHALAEGSTIDFVDSVTFARETLLPHLTIRRQVPDLALHISCGAQHLGIADDLRTLARAVAVRVTEPMGGGCCGFAGDRGFTHPELTASATAPMAAEIAAARCTLGVTSNLPCGIGMARATGIPYRHILEVLEEVSR